MVKQENNFLRIDESTVINGDQWWLMMINGNWWLMVIFMENDLHNYIGELTRLVENNPLNRLLVSMWWSTFTS